MIVLDLDGTILNSNSKVSIKTQEYLNKLKSMGYVIVIATGRIYNSALIATDGAKFANYIISDTGSFIYDLLNDDIILKETIDKTTVQKLLNYYNKDFRYIDVCDINKIYKYSDELENSRIVTTTKDKEFILQNCKDVSHVSISMKNNELVLELYNKLLKDISWLDMIVMQDSFNDRKWIEIIPSGCSKYSAISFLADHLGISNKDIMAFGDGLNDIDMLEKCGYGVALQNSLPPVKNAADDVTFYDNNHDGVTDYLMNFLNIK